MISLYQSWTEAFLQQGGYDAILTRLNEILEVEWRYVLCCRSSSVRVLIVCTEKSSTTIKCSTSCYVV